MALGDVPPPMTRRKAPPLSLLQNWSSLPSARLKTTASWRERWRPSDGTRSRPHLPRSRPQLPRSIAVKAASCISKRIFCSRRRARRPRAAACSRTAAWMNEAVWSCCSLRITRTSRRAKNLRVAACRCTTASLFRSSCIEIVMNADGIERREC